MSQIHVWQVAVDLGLVMTILFMGMRLIRSSAVSSMMPRTMELEASLRALIGEADVAGRTLNDQLLRREQNLQKLLVELEAIEQRISRTMIDAEQRQVELGAEVEKAREVSEEVTRGLSDIQRELGMQEAPAQPTRPATVKTQAAPQSRRQQSAVREPEPLELELETFKEVPPPPSPKIPAQQRIEVRGTTASASRSRDQGSGDVPPAGDRLKAMQDVYKTAEELLRAGSPPEQVSAHTRLNVEQVRLLSQMIEIERDEEAQKGTRRSPEEDRLGVLGGMRRQVQTL